MDFILTMLLKNQTPYSAIGFYSNNAIKKPIGGLRTLFAVLNIYLLGTIATLQLQLEQKMILQEKGAMGGE